MEWIVLGFYPFMWFINIAIIIWGAVDISKRPIKNKLLWFIVIFFGGWIGAIIYYFYGRNEFEDQNNSNPSNVQQPPAGQQPTSTTELPKNNSSEPVFHEPLVGGSKRNKDL